MKTWNKFLKENQDKVISSIDKLPEGTYISVVNHPHDIKVILQNEHPYSRSEHAVGSLFADRSYSDHHTGKCNKNFMVQSSNATQGFGPLLYDVAMEIVSQKGAGLMCDRNSVSPFAYNVWWNYLINRPDVKPVQMDIHYGPHDDDTRFDKLTPQDPSDDCAQTQAIGYAQDNGEPEDWPENALSKGYMKSGTPVIDELKKRDMYYEV